MEEVDGRVYLLLVASGFCAAFGGLQSIAVLEWIQPVLLLQFLYHVRVLDRKPMARAGVLMLTLFTQSVCYGIAYAGEFKNPDFNEVGVFTSFLMSFIFWNILLLVFLTAIRYQKRFPRAISSHPFVFPCVWILFWHLESSFAPIGTTGNPAYTQYGIEPMVLTVALWGLDGIVFFMALTATVAHQRLLLRQEAGASSWIVTAGVCPPSSGSVTEKDEGGSGSEIEVSDNPRVAHKLQIDPEKFPAALDSKRKPGKISTDEIADKVKQHDGVVKVWGVIMILSLLYSGGRKAIFLDGFFEAGIIETYKPAVAVSCILKQPPLMDLFDKQLDTREFLWNATTERARAGDSLIVWSETATIVGGIAGEDELLSKAREILAMERERRENEVKGPNEGPFLGLAYAVLRDGMDLDQAHSTCNVFTFMLPNGSIGFRYEKSHPVPIVEMTTIPGPNELKAVKTPLGTVSAAICFDFQFPRLMGQASYLGADIVLQPSWTWGPIAKQQLKADAFRAVENGFTLVRCSSMGQSAIVTPYYEVQDIRESIDSSVVTMQLPIIPKARTFYPFGGYFFGILVAVVAAKYLFMAWLPIMWVYTVSNIFPGKVNRFFWGDSSVQDAILKRSSTRTGPSLTDYASTKRPLLLE